VPSRAPPESRSSATCWSSVRTRSAPPLGRHARRSTPWTRSWRSASAGAGSPRRHAAAGLERVSPAAADAEEAAAVLERDLAPGPGDLVLLKASRGIRARSSRRPAAGTGPMSLAPDRRRGAARLHRHGPAGADLHQPPPAPRLREADPGRGPAGALRQGRDADDGRHARRRRRPLPRHGAADRGCPHPDADARAHGRRRPRRDRRLRQRAQRHRHARPLEARVADRRGAAGRLLHPAALQHHRRQHPVLVEQPIVIGAVRSSSSSPSSSSGRATRSTSPTGSTGSPAGSSSSASSPTCSSRSWRFRRTWRSSAPSSSAP
jgi:hypothetical protein